MTVASSPLDIVPALDKKIRESVKGTLGWDAAAFTQYSRENRPAIIEYGRVCSAMAERYKQWSSNLSLEWHPDADKSNYLAAYAPAQVPNEVSELADHRMAYLDFLYQHLPPEEQSIFGEMLSPCYLVDGCIPDIKAAYVLYKMQDVFQLEHYRVRDVVDNVLDSRGLRHLRDAELFNVTDLTRKHLDKKLGALIEVSAGGTDSLFARLLLNTAVNRALLELAEHSRLDRMAEVGMVALVRHLQQLYFNRTLPPVHGLEEVSNTVATALGLPAPEYPNWRRFKGASLENVMKRAIAIADVERTMAQYPEAEPYRWHYVLLAGLAVAWSYCTQEQHDPRLLYSRAHDVLNGRTPDDPRTYEPNLLLYHRRQLKLLWFSGQMFHLDAGRASQEHTKSQYLRDTLHAYFYKFKGLTLKQWSKLDSVLSESLAGSLWDREEPLTKYQDFGAV
ncbi:hypothetical protein [Paraburkholderia caribensis]|nr:hypothetical protein [Paraburkholderia caribensis]